MNQMTIVSRYAKCPDRCYAYLPSISLQDATIKMAHVLPPRDL